jgi:uncharacterized damage-inducible protein DinB
VEAIELIVKSLEQSQGELTKALDGLSQQEVTWSPKPDCNSIAFILWHVSRVEDMFVNRMIQGKPELYETGWQEKLGTPVGDTGGGGRYTLEQLQAWTAPKLEILRGYNNVVREATLALLKTLTPAKLDEMHSSTRLPGTIGSLLDRMITEVAMHTGQIAYLRGQQRGINK